MNLPGWIKLFLAQEGVNKMGNIFNEDFRDFLHQLNKSCKIYSCWWLLGNTSWIFKNNRRHGYLG